MSPDPETARRPTERWRRVRNGRDLGMRDAGDALAAELEAERAEHRRTAERWDEERRKWYAERERLVAQLAPPLVEEPKT